MKQLFRYGWGRRETSADAPVIRRATDVFRESGFRFRGSHRYSWRKPWRLRRTELIMSRRVPLTRRLFLRGISLCGARRARRACRRSKRCSTRPAPATPPRPAADRGNADPFPLRAVVQRQRHSRTLLDSGGDGRGLSADPVPRAAGAVSERHPRLSGLDNPAARKPGPGNDHHRSMSGLVSGTSFTGRGAGGPRSTN